MTVKCLNCGHIFKGKYCPNCGQKATVQRLTAAVLLKEILHFFTHLESGFLFTTWKFLVSPGITSLNYVEGKRKKYQKPVSYFLIWTGLYILVHNSIINYFHYQMTSETVAQLDIKEQSNILFRHHFTLFIIPVLLASALLLYLLLARPRFNFTELLTLCLFGAGTYFMMTFFSDLILGYIFNINTLSEKVFLWQGVLSSLYNIWFSFDVFKRIGLRFFWVRLIGVSILIAVTGWLIMIYLPMAWLYYMG